MEKAHGWTYVRTKTNGKKSGSLPSIADNSAQPTPLLEQNFPTPSSEMTGIATPPDDWSRAYAHIEFPTYIQNEDNYNFPQEISLDYSPIDNATPSTDSSMDHNTAYQDIGNDFTMYEDIYSAHVQLPTNVHPVFSKSMTQPFPSFTAAELCQPQPAHISPIGQGNTMLYTPTSLAEVDEGFDDHQDYSGMSTGNGDFILFPGGGVSKPMFNDSLFAPEVPSLAAGYSQPSSQDLINTFQVDWASHDMSTHLHY